jgi:branched-subunit amino acid aminotransferase/4-amino-4-deoxychorismate lyase
VEERPLTTDELLAAREAFLASTTREVQSVAGVEDRDLGEAGPQTLDAAAAVRDHIHAHLG